MSSFSLRGLSAIDRFIGLCVLFCTLVTSGCMPTIRPPLTQTQAIAQHWQGGVNDSVVAGWLQTFHDPQLQSWVAGALADNFSLAEQRTIVAQAKQQWIAQGARIFPELELSSAARRTKAVSTDQSTTLNKELQIAIGINWELDLWGKLRASEREANLAFAAQRAQLQATELDTVAAIGTAWYEHLSAYAQLQLLEKRLHNLTQGLEIIEAGYRKGIHQALDVYLARNEVHQEHARVAAQARLSSESARALHLLVAQYPIDRIAEPPALPVLDTPIPVGVPSALLSRRPDLQAAWLALLAADAQVALRHKQRFPSLVLSGNLQQSHASLNQLFEGNVAWSLVAGLTQPLFNAGRLKAEQALAAARAAQLEQAYLRKVYTAFAEVENAISAMHTLRTQFNAYQQAQKNAVLAQTLAFEQYQKGLITYTTVLESQRRAFDAQTTVIALKKQLLHNRINLHRALGGPFADLTPTTDPQQP